MAYSKKRSFKKRGFSKKSRSTRRGGKKGKRSLSSTYRMPRGGIRL